MPPQPTANDALADPEMSRWFAEEVQPHEAALRNWLRSRYPALSDRDDLVQESYVRLWRARAHGPVGSPKALLFVIARNLALNHLRRLRQVGCVGESELSGVLDDAAPVGDQVARQQEHQLLQQAIQSLPERCREVFVLRRIYGLSQKEIAARLGIAEKTVEVQGLKAIKRCMEFFRAIEHPSVPPAPAAQPTPPPAAVLHAAPIRALPPAHV